MLPKKKRALNSRSLYQRFQRKKGLMISWICISTKAFGIRFQCFKLSFQHNKTLSLLGTKYKFVVLLKLVAHGSKLCVT
ncbi:hypothetical protein MTR67_009352 [Solanum verrucosum]|uniref:Uncharacterized protein n=1 Tax=Solanum verrucosum TaxID=315347 RepID=A0AAF0TDA1_SOLVR|nr:hypothetical protein MTR67_009352 [Solanum verrucosum]